MKTGSQKAIRWQSLAIALCTALSLQLALLTASPPSYAAQSRPPAGWQLPQIQGVCDDLQCG